MGLTLGSVVTLHRDIRMPILGIGTAGAKGDACVAAVREALRIGYRLIDTASMYENEREVGIAIRESGIPRDEIFVTTKIATAEQGPRSTPKALQESLRRLGLDCVDLYLIHWPSRRKRLATWEAMIPLVDRGLARSIGVSNFMVHHLEELRPVNETPAVNQIELSPFLQQEEVVGYCREHRIQSEAYSPLTQGRRLDDPVIGRIAAKYGKTPAQVLLRWSLQRGFIAIPKSARPARIRENAEVFDFALQGSDVRALDGLEKGLHFDWDPSRVP